MESTATKEAILHAEPLTDKKAPVWEARRVLHGPRGVFQADLLGGEVVEAQLAEGLQNEGSRCVELEPGFSWQLKKQGQ